METQFIDLSKMTPEVVKSAVLKNTITSPTTIFPLLGSIPLLAFWAIFDAGVLFVVASGLSLVGGASMFALNYFGRYAVFSSKYFLQLRSENEAMTKKKLEDVESFLDEREFEQGARQVKKLQKSMDSFEKVLDRKFEPHEFARARYHGVAEQVMLNALGNLEQIVTMLVAIDAIDPEYIQNRIDELGDIAHENDGLNDSQMEESEALKDRWELRENQFKIIDHLLSQNEKAMTELGKIATNIATSNVSGNSAEAELDSAIDSLNSLGEDAKKHWA